MARIEKKRSGPPPRLARSLETGTLTAVPPISHSHTPSTDSADSADNIDIVHAFNALKIAPPRRPAPLVPSRPPPSGTRPCVYSWVRPDPRKPPVAVCSLARQRGHRCRARSDFDSHPDPVPRSPPSFIVGRGKSLDDMDFDVYDADRDGERAFNARVVDQTMEDGGNGDNESEPSEPSSDSSAMAVEETMRTPENEENSTEPMATDHSEHGDSTNRFAELCVILEDSF